MFVQLKGKEDRKQNNDNYRLSGNTFRCKIKLCKTFQGREDGDSSSLRLFSQFKKTLKGYTMTKWSARLLQDCSTNPLKRSQHIRKVRLGGSVDSKSLSYRGCAMFILVKSGWVRLQRSRVDNHRRLPCQHDSPRSSLFQCSINKSPYKTTRILN